MGQGKDGGGQETGMACMVWDGKGEERGGQRDTGACLLEVMFYVIQLIGILYSTIDVQNHLHVRFSEMRVYAELRGPASLHFTSLHFTSLHFT